MGLLGRVGFLLWLLLLVLLVLLSMVLPMLLVATCYYLGLQGAATYNFVLPTRPNDIPHFANC